MVAPLTCRNWRKFFQTVDTVAPLALEATVSRLPVDTSVVTPRLSVQFSDWSPATDTERPPTVTLRLLVVAITALTDEVMLPLATVMPMLPLSVVVTPPANSEHE